MTLRGYAYYRNVDDDFGRANALGLADAQDQAWRNRAGLWATLWRGVIDSPGEYRTRNRRTRNNEVPLPPSGKERAEQGEFFS